MVRPLSGARPKKRTTISVDPVVYKTFQKLVESKQPDGDKSSSSHLETLMKREIAKVQGSELPEVVDVESLQRQLANLKKRHNDLVNAIKNAKEKNPDRFNTLAAAYNLDMEHFTNAEEVIRNVLQDKDKAIEKYLTGEEDLAIFVTLLEINSKIEKIIQQILNAQKDKYLHMTTHQEASEKGEEAEEKNEPAHEDDEDDDDYESEEGVY